MPKDEMMEVHSVFIAIGSNLEPREERMTRAVQALRNIGAVTATSSVYESEPAGVTDQPKFLNAVIRMDTPLGATELLSQLRDLERQLGRTPRARWHEREIDFDIIFFDNEVASEPELQIPHPEMQNRNFVLIPLVDLDANFVHPVLALSVTKLLSQLPEPTRGIVKTSLVL